MESGGRGKEKGGTDKSYLSHTEITGTAEKDKIWAGDGGVLWSITSE